ncbi:MAG: BON domain-containing protein [Desulfovibrio sp.]|nr:BON domain-containing protein [Desulfovibrio sp.]
MKPALVNIFFVFALAGFLFAAETSFPRDAWAVDTSYLEDSYITSKVKASFLTTDGLESRRIFVETNSGVVLLTGQVANETQRQLAEALTKNIEGVKGVINKISVMH